MREISNKNKPKEGKYRRNEQEGGNQQRQKWREKGKKGINICLFLFR
jgi:hypothetical protein